MNITNGVGPYVHFKICLVREQAQESNIFKIFDIAKDPLDQRQEGLKKHINRNNVSFVIRRDLHTSHTLTSSEVKSGDVVIIRHYDKHCFSEYLS